MERITIGRIKKTCNACPAQWEAYDEYGNYVYIRYRWGYLQIDVSDSMEKWWDDLLVHRWDKQVGDGYDGYMSFEELKENLPDWIVIPDHVEEK